MKKLPSSDDSCLITLDLESHTVFKLKQKAEQQDVSLNDLILSLINEAVNNDDSIMDIIGANRNSGLYESVDYIDSTISELRDEWD